MTSSSLQFPSLNSQQRLDGQARNKVALKPGHSLMDWIRLTHSGKDLTGVNGRLLDVTPEELSKHNTLEDCWISLKGKVYNVTAYMDFHPGGPDELMRGVGKEAISLFNDVHKWVNYESMLEKCLLGRLKSPSNFLLRVIGDLPPPSNTNANEDAPSYDWFQSDRTVSIVVSTRWKDIKQEHILVDLVERKFRVTMYVQSSTFLFHLELGGEVSNDYSVKIGCESGVVEMLLHKGEEGCNWPDLGSPLDQHLSFGYTKDREIFYRRCALRKKSEVTHDIYLFTFELPCRMLVPLGHHIFLRAQVEGMETTRSYTPVLPSLETQSSDLVSHDSFVHLMVKIYANGAFTPVLHRLQIGETMELGDYAGSFDYVRLAKCLTVVLIAAGTGFTPMVGLISRVLNETDTQVRLMLFNKTEKDIPWRENLDTLAETNSRFLLRHVLSNADESWTGAKGRIRKHLLEKFLPPLTDDGDTLVCICGPTPFTKSAVKYLEEMGYPPEDIHAFLG